MANLGASSEPLHPLGRKSMLFNMPSEGAGRSPHLQLPSEGRHIKVLLVEDDPEDALLLERALRKSRISDFSVTRVETLAGAVDYLRHIGYDVVLLDLSLPDSTGLDTIANVQAETSRVPLIVLSGLDDEDLVMNSMRGGAQDYLIKGQIGTALLERSILYAIERKRAEDELQASYDELEVILRGIADGITVQDAQGRLVYVNDAAARSLGYASPSEMLSTSRPRLETRFELKDEKGNPLPFSKLPGRLIFEGVECSEMVVCWHDLETGEERWSVVKATPILNDRGDVRFAINIFQDITDRKKHEQALLEAHEELEKRVEERTAELAAANRDLLAEVAERRRIEDALRVSEERYTLTALGSNDGLWDWDTRLNRVYYSSRWKSMLGYRDHEIGESPNEWFSRVHPDDLEAFKAQININPSGRTAHFESEYRMLCKDGVYRWMLSRGLILCDTEGVPVRMAGSQSDITARKLASDQLAHQAFYDPLTNLPNRALFLERLERAMAHSKRNPDYLFAVLFLDLDRFKIVNDSLGHMTGNELLQVMAARLQSCMRTTDTVARFGGDEFALLLDGIKRPSDATRFADRILKRLRAPVKLEGHEAYTTASIGIALSTTGYEKAEDMLRDGDTAMYRAKALGKARYQLFDTQMHATAVELLQLEADLRRAIERKELRIYYQPIISLTGGRITGFEALLRWQHPTRGLLPPNDFIPVAEETGLIVPIGLWVLREACRQMREWQVQFGLETALSVSVNLSTTQFAEPDLAKEIGRILAETSLDAGSLRLEITESTLMANTEHAISILTQLRDLGVPLYMDDFGTGYSSLSYLQRFPISALKIDRSFISRMGAESGNSELVRTIVTLARNLHMEVIAEGVETDLQLNELQTFECEYAQGFLFSKPVDANVARAFIASAQEVG